MDINLEDAVRVYITNRKHLEALKDKYDEDKKAIEDSQKILEAFFQERMLQLGLTKLPTDSGTPYSSVVQKFTVKDRVAFMKFAVENNLTDFFTNTLAKPAVVEYMKENNQQLPPGVEMSQIININVRAS